jgi:hypothetical protein
MPYLQPLYLYHFQTWWECPDLPESDFRVTVVIVGTERSYRFSAEFRVIEAEDGQPMRDAHAAATHAAPPTNLPATPEVLRTARFACSSPGPTRITLELAAARAADFGFDGVAGRLDDRFRLLTGGRL